MKKMDFMMSNPMKMVKSMMSLPTPLSISFLWNLGFMLGVTLMVQIISGLVLSMNYVPSTEMAFQSVIHIMRDIDSGWLVRYTHMNGASLFFILIYTHMARGVYFNSPSKQASAWVSGVVLLLLSMASAFMGYVLPWGQMSYWGATVITSMLSAIPYMGKPTVLWLWGNFSVSQPTLNRFFSFHFILPLVLLVMVVVHLALLHESGSSNPTGTKPDLDKMSFFPYFMVKDLVPMSLVAILMMMMISAEPNMLGDVENFNQVSTASTPLHIQPEWYFLFTYAILRTVPSKLGGVVAMMGAILISLTLTMKSNKLNKKFSPYKKMLFFLWISSILLLTWLGANPVEAPFSDLSKIMSTAYFTLSIMM